MLICGDFNEICSIAEKIGGRERSLSQINQFNKVIQDLGLFDMDFEGYPFMWRWGNGHWGVEKRLDRALATLDWLDAFPNVQVVHLSFLLSDHTPLLFKIPCQRQLINKTKWLRFEKW